MGLLSHMEALHAVESSQREKVFTECSAFSSSTTELIDFHDFAKKNDLPFCALLIPFNNHFFMRYSHGFDVDTILKSVSSVDFWDGTIQKDKWVTYSGSTLEPFYQFFSQNFLTTLNTLHIKTFDVLDTKVIFLILNTELQQENIDKNIFELKNYLSSEIKNFPNYNFRQIHKKNDDCQNKKSFTIDISNIMSDIKKDIDLESQNILLPVIKSEIYSKVSEIIDLTDYCYIMDEKIYIDFYSAQSLEQDLLQFQINKILANVLQKYSTKLIVYSN